MSNALQGYGAIADCRIKDNWGVLTAHHGINFSGATNCTYENNRVIHASGANEIWVNLGWTKNKRRPSGNTVSDNIANKIRGKQGGVFSGNFTVNILEYDRIFADWRAGDLRLISKPQAAFKPKAKPGKTSTKRQQPQLPPAPTWQR